MIYLSDVYSCHIQGHLCCALQDQQTALGKLGLELHQRYPFVVPSSFVWGFGRPLWDPAARVLGLKPLRVMVLGPASSGKSMQCSMLAERYAHGGHSRSSSCNIVSCAGSASERSSERPLRLLGRCMEHSFASSVAEGQCNIVLLGIWDPTEQCWLLRGCT